MTVKVVPMKASIGYEPRNFFTTVLHLKDCGSETLGKLLFGAPDRT